MNNNKTPEQQILQLVTDTVNNQVEALLFEAYKQGVDTGMRKTASLYDLELREFPEDFYKECLEEDINGKDK